MEFKYSDVLVLEFQVFEHPQEIEDTLQKMNIGIHSSVQVQDDRERLYLDLEFVSKTDVDGDEKDCFKIKIRNVFTFSNLDEYLNGDNLSMSKEDMSVLSSISYSTARGILKEKLGSTRYGRSFLLPVIDPSELVKNISANNVSEEAKA